MTDAVTGRPFVMAGYSGTPLVRKLDIGERMRVGVRHAPANFAAALAPWPEGARITTPGSGPLDVLVIFAREAATLEREFGVGVAFIRTDGMLWAAWPKKAAKLATDLTEDVVRRIGLAAGLVDVKVCAIDDVWSGLKFVRRVADRRALRR